MALKTTNYTINGYTYPEVVAVFNGEIRPYGNDFEVGFNIHATKELALTQKPFEVKRVIVKGWDRKCDLVELAYTQAKFYGPEKTIEWQGKMGIVPAKYGVFYGWEDYIV